MYLEKVCIKLIVECVCCVLGRRSFANIILSIMYCIIQINIYINHELQSFK